MLKLALDPVHSWSNYHSLTSSCMHPNFIVSNNSLPHIPTTTARTRLLTVALKAFIFYCQNINKVFCRSAESEFGTATSLISLWPDTGFNILIPSEDIPFWELQRFAHILPLYRTCWNLLLKRISYRILWVHNYNILSPLGSMLPPSVSPSIWHLSKILFIISTWSSFAIRAVFILCNMSTK